MVARRDIVANFVLVEDGHRLRIVQAPIIVPVIVRVFPAFSRRVRTVNLTRILLRQLHENYGTLRDDCVDDEGRENYDKYGA